MAEPLSRVVAKALSKDAALRYPTAAELHAAILEARRSIAEGSTEPQSSLRGRAATVGREAERAEMRTAFRNVATGSGHVLSISGEPGAGKTTVVEEFLHALPSVSPSCLIGRGRCSERLAGAEAYLPILEVLDGWMSANEPVRALLNAVAPAWYAQMTARADDASPLGIQLQPVTQERLKRELVVVLRELSRTRPVVLFLDDVHWADPSTVDLLGYVAARFDELRVLVVVTSRPSDLSLSNHPFLALRRDLQSRRRCHEVRLDMLTRRDVEEYLALEFDDHGFPPGLAAVIHAKTEGNPLFMADLVRYLVTNGTIARDAGGRWALEGAPEAIGVEWPESVRAMIDRKIAQLGDEDRVMLTAASVRGYAFETAVVARVLSLPAAVVEERLEALERTHRLVTMVDERDLPDGTLTSRYRFVHVLYQNALYRQLRAVRRVELSSAVAGGLTHYYGSRDEEIAAELASLHENARNALQAAHYYRVAAHQAARLFASREVLVLATRGLSLIEKAPEGTERQEIEIALLIAAGNAFIALRGYSSDEVRDTYTRALAVSEQLGETRERAAVLYGFSAFHLVAGRHPEALTWADALLDFTERTRHPASIVGHRIAGWALLAMGQPEAALTHFERCRALYDASTHNALAYSFGQEPGMAARVVHALNLARLDRHDDARRILDEAMDMCRHTSHANSRCYVLHFAAVGSQWIGDRESTRSFAVEALQIAEEQGLALWVGWSRIMHGWARADEGQLEAGVLEMRSGIDTAKSLGHELLNSHYLTLLAEMLVRAGRFDDAAATLDEADWLVSHNQERIAVDAIARLRAQLAEARRSPDASAPDPAG